MRCGVDASQELLDAARKTHENDADAASLEVGAGVGDVVGSGVGSLEVGAGVGPGVGDVVGSGVGSLEVDEGVGSLEVGAGVGDVVGSGVGDVVGSGVGSLEEFPLRSTGRPCALRLLRRRVAASDAYRPRRALRDWG